MQYLFLFFQALVLTVSIECIVALVLQKYAGPRLKLKTPPQRLLGIVALASVFTLPYIWFVAPELIKNRWIFGISAEIFAFIMEAVWYFLALKISAKHALALSFITNLASFTIGLFVLS
jgi:hypothetical protein